MLDVRQNRQTRKWSRGEQFGRVLWALFQPLFTLSPRIMWGWRRWLLRRFGATVGKNVHIYPTVRITMPWNLRIGEYAAIGDHVILYALGVIHIGKSVTVSQGAHLCAGSHDYRDATMPLLKTPINVGDEAWICADAFLGPGCTVGAHSIVGARAVVVRDIAPRTIACGNPARPIGPRPEPRQEMSRLQRKK